MGDGDGDGEGDGVAEACGGGCGEACGGSSPELTSPELTSPDGDGGWNCTTKELTAWEPLAREKACPKPGAAHSAPFQPSPYESVISRVHVAPSATTKGALELYGAPPLSVVPSEQLRLQPTSSAYDPLEQVIVEKAVTHGGDGGLGDDGEGRGEAPCAAPRTMRKAVARSMLGWLNLLQRKGCVALGSRLVSTQLRHSPRSCGTRGRRRDAKPRNMSCGKV